MRPKRGQKGQAIVELTVSLVGILAVFCGFLLISKLSIQNVDNIIKTRGDSDDNAINSRISDTGHSISSWSAGNDKNMYTADDTMNSTGIIDPTFFSGQLQNNNFSLTNDLSKPYIRDNFSKDVGNLDFIFVNAAELTSGSNSSQVQLDDLERLLFVYPHVNQDGVEEVLLHTDSFSLKDEIFMPFTDHSLN